MRPSRAGYPAFPAPSKALVPLVWTPLACQKP